jgi:hypothetical protein
MVTFKLPALIMSELQEVFLGISPSDRHAGGQKGKPTSVL